VEAALRGIAEVHAVWFGREVELSVQPWLGPTLSAQDMADMKDLWNCLADYSARFFTAWVGADLRPLQRDLIAGVSQWWPCLEVMPRTLIHNDFNPRNVALRRTAGELRLCAYDWELATLGVPQHDLAEFLCFVLPSGFSRADVLAHLEEHRRALERATGRGMDAASWQLGFALSLADLMVNRLPMYCLVHTFRRQPFLERVVRTWRRLYEIFAPAGLRP
jgi:hydroxymethylglutaryl-CoA reductase (NADPH)